MTDLEFLKTKIPTGNLGMAVGHLLNQEDFQQARGSRYKHSAEFGGLLKHLVCHFRCLDKLLELSEFAGISKGIAAGAIFFHDAGKMYSYQQNGKGEYEYTMEERQLGHICRSLMIWDEYCFIFDVNRSIQKSIAHCILASHGRKNWRSPIEPQTKEAWLLHLIDMISARVLEV